MADINHYSASGVGTIEASETSNVGQKLSELDLSPSKSLTDGSSLVDLQRVLLALLERREQLYSDLKNDCRMGSSGVGPGKDKIPSGQSCEEKLSQSLQSLEGIEAQIRKVQLKMHEMSRQVSRACEGGRSAPDGAVNGGGVDSVHYDCGSATSSPSHPSFVPSSPRAVPPMLLQLGCWPSGPHPESSMESASMISFNSTMEAGGEQAKAGLEINAKVEMVYSLISMLGSQQDRNESSQVLLSLSRNRDTALIMRQSGCLAMVVQLLHPRGSESLWNTTPDPQDWTLFEQASMALRNLVVAGSDPIRTQREAAILKPLEQIRAYTMHLRFVKAGLQRLLGDVCESDVCPSVSLLMRFSFEEENRHSTCQLGGLHAIADLLIGDYLVFGDGSETPNSSVDLRRYIGMTLTNLTFGDAANKATLCATPHFLQILNAMIASNNEDLRQVFASVVRNLSWKADGESKSGLRESGCVHILMEAAMKPGQSERTLKSLLSALWNLSSHSSENKEDICRLPGALEFLVRSLAYQSGSDSYSVVENGGGILRNISSHIGVKEEYRAILRRHGCMELLLKQLKSPSLTVVGNACGALWNLSARNLEDQQLLLDLGAVPMLRSLRHSKHRLISMGSQAVLKNLTSALLTSGGRAGSGGPPPLNCRTLDDAASVRTVDGCGAQRRAPASADMETVSLRSGVHRGPVTKGDLTAPPPSHQPKSPARPRETATSHIAGMLADVVDYVNLDQCQMAARSIGHTPATSASFSAASLRASSAPVATAGRQIRQSTAPPQLSRDEQMLQDRAAVQRLHQTMRKRSQPISDEQLPTKQDFANSNQPEPEPAMAEYDDVEMPKNFASEGTPANMSKWSSISSLNAEDCDKHEMMNDQSKPSLPTYLHGTMMDPISVQATPGIGSRRSSLSSLNDCEIKSTVDSVYSQQATGYCSPSDLPASPGRTMPPSPTRERSLEPPRAPAPPPCPDPDSDSPAENDSDHENDERPRNFASDDSDDVSNRRLRRGQGAKSPVHVLTAESSQNSSRQEPAVTSLGDKEEPLAQLIASARPIGRSSKKSGSANQNASLASGGVVDGVFKVPPVPPLPLHHHYRTASARTSSATSPAGLPPARAHHATKSDSVALGERPEGASAALNDMIRSALPQKQSRSHTPGISQTSGSFWSQKKGGSRVPVCITRPLQLSPGDTRQNQDSVRAYSSEEGPPPRPPPTAVPGIPPSGPGTELHRFVDQVRVFAVEGTPSIISGRSSLSDLCRELVEEANEESPAAANISTNQTSAAGQPSPPSTSHRNSQSLDSLDVQKLLAVDASAEQNGESNLLEQLILCAKPKTHTKARRSDRWKGGSRRMHSSQPEPAPTPQPAFGTSTQSNGDRLAHTGSSGDTSGPNLSELSCDSRGILEVSDMSFMQSTEGELNSSSVNASPQRWIRSGVSTGLDDIEPPDEMLLVSHTSSIMKNSNTCEKVKDGSSLLKQSLQRSSVLLSPRKTRATTAHAANVPEMTDPSPATSSDGAPGGNTTSDSCLSEDNYDLVNFDIAPEDIDLDLIAEDANQVILQLDEESMPLEELLSGEILIDCETVSISSTASSSKASGLPMDSETVAGPRVVKPSEALPPTAPKVVRGGKRTYGIGPRQNSAGGTANKNAAPKMIVRTTKTAELRARRSSGGSESGVMRSPSAEKVSPTPAGSTRSVSPRVSPLAGGSTQAAKSKVQSGVETPLRMRVNSRTRLASGGSSTGSTVNRLSGGSVGSGGSGEMGTSGDPTARPGVAKRPAQKPAVPPKPGKILDAAAASDSTSAARRNLGKNVSSKIAQLWKGESSGIAEEKGRCTSEIAGPTTKNRPDKTPERARSRTPVATSSDKENSPLPGKGLSDYSSPSDRSERTASQASLDQTTKSPRSMTADAKRKILVTAV